jgi:TonB-dependent SusC/RagA subfamily outer membrane receptor
LELSKYAFLLPVFLIAGMSFTVSKAENNIEKIVEKSQQTTVISEPLNVKLKGEVGELLKNTIGTDIISVDTSQQIYNADYPLAPSTFNKEELRGKNLYFKIDEKLVSLDEFYDFSRSDIYAVDIYTDKEYILKKIGKENAEGYFVITSRDWIAKNYPVEQLQKMVNEGNERGLTFTVEENGKKRVIKGQSADFEALKKLAPFYDYESSKKVSANPRQKFSYRMPEKQPFYIINGEEKGHDYDATMIMIPENHESFLFLKEKEAIAKYGEKGKYGVVVINTKDYHQKKVDVKIKEAITREIENERKQSGFSGISFQADSTRNSKDRIIIKGVESLGFHNISPLIIVDEKEMDNFDMNSLDVNIIESISVLKDQSATAIYGDKGKNGVIIIQTKTSDNDEVVVTGFKNGNSSNTNKTPTKGNVKEVVVVGYKKDSNNAQQDNTIIDNRGSSTWKNDYYSSLNNFLEKNKSQIDLSKGYVLIIDNKLATENDLKKINKDYVKTISATDIIGNKDISVDFSNKLAGILRLTTTSNKSEAVRSMSASVENNGKSYKLLVDNNSNHPIIKIQ